MPIIKTRIDTVVHSQSFRDEIDEEHARSLADKLKRGVWLPPPVAVKDGNRYRIISGAHRLRAHILAGLGEIEVMVVESVTPLQEAQEAWNENEGRKGFNFCEQTGLVQFLIGQGLSQQQIAEALGISESRVSKLLTVSKRLATDLQQLVVDGKLGVSEAYIIAKISDFDKQRQLADRCIKGTIKRAGLEREVKILRGQRVRKVQPKRLEGDGVTIIFDGDLDNEALMEALKPIMGRLRKGAKLSAEPETAPIML